MLRQALFATLAMLAIEPANAAVLVTPTLTITLPDGTSDYTMPYTVSLFDTNFGKLLAVNMSASYGFTAMVSLTAQAQSSGVVRVESAMGVSSSDTHANSIISSILNEYPTAIGSNFITAALDVLGRNKIFQISSSDTTVVSSDRPIVNDPTSPQYFITNTGVQSDENEADLAVFATQGGGTLPIAISTTTGSLISISGGQVSAQISDLHTGGSFSIFYTYDDQTAVTEPATAFLIAIPFGVVAIGQQRRANRTRVGALAIAGPAS